MTTKIIAARPEDSVLDVARIMVEKNFDGVPIVDKTNKLVGMVTMKEMLDNKGLYLPTVLRILNELQVAHSHDVAEVDEKLKLVKNLRAESIMNHDPHYLSHDTSLEKASEAFLLWREDPLPVVDSYKSLIGIVSKYDVLKALTHPLTPTSIRPDVTGQTESLNVLENLEQKFVVVSKTRFRFWYLAGLVFLALGILIAIALILRIRIF